MRRDRIAEWVLELVTAHERAASTVGDLRESAATRGEAWFWSSVLRTMGSLMWRGMIAEPRMMLWLALRAWLVGLGLCLGGLACIIGLSAAFGLMYAVVRNGSVAVGWAPGAVLHWIFGSIGFSMAMLFEFLMGRWIARRAPGREVPAWLALWILQLVVAGAIAIGITLAKGHPEYAIDVPENLLGVSAGLLGALSVRRRRSAQ